MNLIVMLLLYPLISFVAPAVFFLLWPEEIHSLPTLPLDATDEEGRSTVVRVGVNQPLTFYVLLLGCAILWTWLSQGFLPESAIHIEGWAWGTLKGGYVGLSWAGLWLWLWLVLSNPSRLTREVPGYQAPFFKQIIVCVVGAFSEELWRVLCIVVMIASGYSAGFSVSAVALVYAVAYLINGPERSILAAIEGAIFGILFVWQRSFFAPFAAHLAVQGVYLWGLGQFAPEGQRKSWMRGIRCPVCKAQLTRLQIKLRDPFNCPSCHEQISVSDGYRNAMRLGGTFAYMFVSVSTMLLFEKQMPDTIAILLLWPVAFGVGTSGLLLYQRVFPPRLQYGSPTFITLNLEHRRKDMNDPENKKD